jgi:hypothetical protein
MQVIENRSQEEQETIKVILEEEGRAWQSQGTRNIQ